MSDYRQNTGSTTLRFLDIFKAPLCEDISLTHWMALTPRELADTRLQIPPDLLDTLCKEKPSVVAA